MNTRLPLLSALLLGGLAVSAPAMATEPVATDVVEAAFVVSADAPVAPVEKTAAATAEEATEAAVVADAPEAPTDAAVEEEPAPVAIAPAWEGLVPVEAEMQLGSNGQPVGDRTLRVVQRSTTGKVVAAQVAMSLFSGHLGGGSTFKKDQLKGSRVKEIENPAFGYLQDKVRAALTTYFTAHPGALPEEEKPVVATADAFNLIYQELDNAETQYELRQTVHLGFPYRRRLLTLKLTGGEGVQCGQEAPATATLEAWQADDYALLKETAQRNADACVAKFVEVLPTLFPDRAPVAAEPAVVDAAVEQGV